MVIWSMWRRWGYLVHEEEMGYLVHMEEMGLFSPGEGDGFI